MRDLSRGVKECNTPEALFSYKRLSKICMYTLSPLRVSSVSRHKLNYRKLSLGFRSKISITNRKILDKKQQ